MYPPEPHQFPEAIPPQVMLMQMATSNWVSQSIYVTAKLGIADLLADGAKNYTELAAATKTNAPALFRLLRAVASLGILTEWEPGYFDLTPMGAYLRTDIPDSMNAMSIMNGEEQYRAWGDLRYSIETGKSAFDRVYGMPIFEYLRQNPAAGEVFDRAMTTHSKIEIPALVTGYDFAGIDTLVDVAGGLGSTLSAILEANPQLQAILFDVEEVIATATPLIARSNVAERCRLVSGDFFKSVPTGGDVYMLKHIIHDWDDDRSISILQNCHAAMSAGSRLLLIEQVIPPGNDPFVGKLIDLNMLVCQAGCERTEDEYRSLLQRSGFELTQTIFTHAPTSIIEAIRL